MMNPNNWLSSHHRRQYTLDLAQDNMDQEWMNHVDTTRGLADVPKVADFLGGVCKLDNPFNIATPCTGIQSHDDPTYLYSKSGIHSLSTESLLTATIPTSTNVFETHQDITYNNELQALTLSTGSVNKASTAEASNTDNIMNASSAIVEVKKTLDTFGQRTSIYRGVTRHRWTGRYEAHLWDNSCKREGQSRKGRQVYLGGYDNEDKAARAYDLAALKYWGTSATTNFPITTYEKEIEDMQSMTRQEFIASIRRKSSGFSRGASMYRGVTRHHQHGRWQARIGRVAGNKDLYLGTFSTEEEAAEAYDIAAIKFRGLEAVTNFEMNRYDVKSILESVALPVGGGAAKRLKEAHAVESAKKSEHSSMLGLTPCSSTFQFGHSGLTSSSRFQPYGYSYPAALHEQVGFTDQFPTSFLTLHHNNNELNHRYNYTSQLNSSGDDIQTQLQLRNSQYFHEFAQGDHELMPTGSVQPVVDGVLGIVPCNNTDASLAGLTSSGEHDPVKVDYGHSHSASTSENYGNWAIDYPFQGSKNNLGAFVMWSN